MAGLIQIYFYVRFSNRYPGVLKMNFLFIQNFEPNNSHELEITDKTSKSSGKEMATNFPIASIIPKFLLNSNFQTRLVIFSFLIEDYIYNEKIR